MYLYDCFTNFNISKYTYLYIYAIIFFRMPVPELPTHQDCHELWSKKRRRQMREAEIATANQPLISTSRGGSIPSLPGSEKLEDNSQR